MTAGNTLASPMPQADHTPANPASADSSLADPRDGRWPLRPLLSLMLLLGVLTSVAAVTFIHRGESTVGALLASAVGLSAHEPKAPEPVRILTWQDDGGWERVDRSASPEYIKGVEELIETKNLPAAEFTVQAEPFERRGLWAPTSVKLRLKVERTAYAGRADLSGEAANGALDAVADQLQERRQWAQVAGAVRDFDGSRPMFEGVAERLLKNGVAHNILAAGMLLGLGLSLTRRPNGLHETYDSGIRLFKSLGLAAVLGVVWTACPAILGFGLLYFLGDIAAFLRSNPTLGWFGYVAVFVVSAGVGFLPTYGQSFLGGWVFGFALGFPGAMLGFIGGSMIGYVIARGVSRERVLATIDANPKARKVRDALVGRGFWKTLGIVTLIRVPPNSPFALTNLVLASSGVGMLPYVIGTAIGMAPRTAIAVWIAARASATGARDIQQLLDSQPWWVFPATIGLLAVVLGILGWIANRALHEVTKERPELDPAAD